MKCDAYGRKESPVHVVPETKKSRIEAMHFALRLSREKIKMKKATQTYIFIIRANTRTYTQQKRSILRFNN